MDSNGSRGSNKSTLVRWTNRRIGSLFSNAFRAMVDLETTISNRQVRDISSDRLISQPDVRRGAHDGGNGNNFRPLPPAESGSIHLEPSHNITPNRNADPTSIGKST